MGSCWAISSITLASSPLSSATRRVKLSLKSISPRMALSVMAFTSAPTPALSASSSMHSAWISVESMSKQMSRRMRRYMSSFWNEKSISISDEMRISSSCMAARSVGVPRSENSMQALTLRSGCMMLMRPVSLRMESMFSPCLAITFVAASICRAESVRPMRVRINRFLPCRSTQFSYSSSVTGAKPMFTPSSVALNSSSFMTCPEASSLMRIRMPSDSVEWMSACPISSMRASLRDSISITEAVRPGRSLPVILMSICSSFGLLCSMIRVFRAKIHHFV